MAANYTAYFIISLFCCNCILMQLNLFISTLIHNLAISWSICIYLNNIFDIWKHIFTFFSFYSNVIFFFMSALYAFTWLYLEVLILHIKIIYFYLFLLETWLLCLLRLGPAPLPSYCSIRAQLWLLPVFFWSGAVLQLFKRNN